MLLKELKVISCEAITKGWSKDKKFHLVLENGSHALLRVSSTEKAESKKQLFEVLGELAKVETSVPMPLAFVVEGEEVFELLSWIEGTDAIEILPTLPTEKQYALGVEAGKLLKNLHQIHPKEDLPPFEDRYQMKINRVLKSYEDCPIKIPGGERIVNFIKENRYLVTNRPQTFQHGDFHIGNFVVTPSGKLAVIDFNRSSFGDPLEEFDRIIWSLRLSQSFVCGQFHGYFDGDLQEEAFALIALYQATTALASLPWAIPFGQDEIDEMQINAKKILSYYDQFKTVIPHWYQMKKEKGKK